MTKFAFVQVVSVVAVVLAGCAGNDGGGGGDEKPTKPAPTGDKPPVPTPDPTQQANPTEPPPGFVCSAPGDKGNNLGVGAYCEKGGKCGTGLLCSGDFGAPTGFSMCTTICTTDAECGKDARCYAGDTRGNACIPTKCLPAK